MTTYRSRTHRPPREMSWADWRIALAIAFPAALIVGAAAIRLVFG